MSNLVKNKAKFGKKPLICLGSKQVFFDIFFKRLYEENLKICRSIVIETFKPVAYVKWRPLKFFAKLHKSPLLIANAGKLYRYQIFFSLECVI